MKFYQWFTQAFGSIVGMICCIFFYLRGNLLLYSNLNGNYDAINFNEVLASYILYPLCLFTFFTSIIISLIPNFINMKIMNIEWKKINDILRYSTSFVGILGCNIYFILPAFFLLFTNILSFINYIGNRYSSKCNSLEDSFNEKEIQLKEDFRKVEDIDLNINQITLTKNEIAIHLLKKNSNINFICDITGLSSEYINKLKKEALHSYNNER